MTKENRIAIFVDVENLTQWIKEEGLVSFFKELSSIGTVLVRKAYARWTNPNISIHQASLNRLGFELIHTFHPVSGKNSADIQITVDVMDYASREDIHYIVLATGDSDFSPLFRRLREKGKNVFGVGPRSALSESVKSSCSRFFTTETSTKDESEKEATHISAYDDAIDLLESTLKTFEAPANCSSIKSRMLIIDSAFDEKILGFKNFTDFLHSVEWIELKQENNVNIAQFKELKNQSEFSKNSFELNTSNNTTDNHLLKILRKKGWRTIPANTMTLCIKTLQSIGPFPRSEIRELLSFKSGGQITTSDSKKALELLTKAGLMRAVGLNDTEEVLWEIFPLSEPEIFWAIDRAMTVRILSGLQELGQEMDRMNLAALLFSQQGKSDIDKLLSESQQMHRNPSKVE